MQIFSAKGQIHVIGLDILELRGQIKGNGFDLVVLLGQIFWLSSLFTTCPYTINATADTKAIAPK